MAEVRRNTTSTKKDQQSPRDVREEIGEEIQSGVVQPKQTHPNRDRARGDRDRTGDHHDEGTNRSEE
jgi:hypothetical protein